MACNKCRICLNMGSWISLFEKLDSVMISTKIMSFANIQIHPNDGLPGYICSKCIKTVNACYKFIKVCEKTDLQLRSLLHYNDESRQDSYNLFASESSSDVFIDEDTSNSYNEQCFVEISLSSVTETRTVNEDTCIMNKTVPYDQNLVNNCDKKRKPQSVQCSTCGKVMSSRFRLKTHLRTHTGERPYPCPHCTKKFSLAQNLKVHIRTHTGEKPLKCTECGETFAQASGLVAHRRKHTGQTPYQCSLCPRSFRTPGHLQYHIRCHTGEKNFECGSCDRAFITRSDLKQHLVVHSGDKPHVCCVCGLRLARASHLKRHMTVHKGTVESEVETNLKDSEECKNNTSLEIPVS